MNFSRPRLSLLGLFFLSTAAARSETALEAVRALPKGEGRHVLQIEGRETGGASEPWRILTGSPKGSGKWHEYVVSQGEIVASSELPPERDGSMKNLLDLGAVKIDSDQVVRMARESFQRAGVQPAYVACTLQRQGLRAAPVWVATGMNAQAAELSSLVITASRGNIVEPVGAAAAERSAVVAPAPAAAAAAVPNEPVGVSDREFLAGLESRGASPEAGAPLEPPATAAPAPDAPASEPIAPPTVSGDAGEDNPVAPVAGPEAGNPPVHTSRAAGRSVSPVAVAGRVTAPVRRLIRRVLPF